jgi:hypothetical protein
LDEGQLSPIFDYPEYSSLFCEPPEWIFKSWIYNWLCYLSLERFLIWLFVLSFCF